MAKRRNAADWTDVLATVPLFASLPRRHVARLTKVAKIQRLPAYTRIVRAGERGDSFCLLLEGTASVKADRRRAVTIGPGDFFGELSLLDGLPRSATVEAQEEVLLARIGRKDFLKLVQSEPKVAVALLKTMAGRLRGVERATTAH
jgi:CRP/FNR family transcriptional regulator, cyclic AMP receptor protein